MINLQKLMPPVITGGVVGGAEILDTNRGWTGWRSSETWLTYGGSVGLLIADAAGMRLPNMLTDSTEPLIALAARKAVGDIKNMMEGETASSANGRVLLSKGTPSRGRVAGNKIGSRHPAPTYQDQFKTIRLS